MDIELKEKCDLLVRNRKTMSDAFSFESSYMTHAAALLLTSEGMEADKDYAKQCKQIIKNNTGFLSNFRGNVMHPIICKMMLSNNPEGYFKKVAKAHEATKKLKWVGEDYKILAALVICDHVDEADFEKYVDRTEAIYQKMKQQHSLLTGSEDVPFAALLAVSDIEIDKLILDMEESYKVLKPKFSDANAVQSLSHILCLDGNPTEEKCNKIMAIFDELKALKHKYGASYELSSLGTLSMLDMSEKQIAICIAEADDYLKQQKGFGDLALGAKERRLFAAQLVLQTYGKQAQASNSVALTSMLALTIAIEICMIVCITTCVMTTTVSD